MVKIPLNPPLEKGELKHGDLKASEKVYARHKYRSYPFHHKSCSSKLTINGEFALWGIRPHPLLFPLSVKRRGEN